MSQLEYDNLYKFLVSLGVTLIALPVAGIIYFYNTQPILISQADYDALSEYSLEMINHRDKLLEIFMRILPWLAVIFIVFGFVLFIYGIIKWLGVQKKLDKKLDAETTKKALDALKANDEDVQRKVKKETEKFSDISNVYETNDCISVSKSQQLKAIQKYYAIEASCFDYFSNKYYKKYDFKCNIRIGNTYYDFIGVSNEDKQDLIFEIKYYQQAISANLLINKNLDKIYDMGIKYQTVTHRDFKCLLIIITPKEQLPRLEKIVNSYYETNKEYKNKIEIKCLSEESL